MLLIMIYVDNEQHHDPRINLAIEEHLLRNLDLDEPILFFYINEPSVIIGRNQNTLEEIDPDFIRAQDIHVVRRLSGGGAVYHDLGNLNFSFITHGRQHIHDFARFTDPVVRVLADLGIEAELRQQSSLFVGEKKISGNAQYAAKGRMFSHGTLLFDTDLEMMLKALNPRQVQIESKAVQSVRNFVANIRELLDSQMTIQELRQRLLEGIFEGTEIPTYQLNENDWQQIEQLTADRYRQWDWNYGRSPKFNVHKSERFPSGKVDLRIHVENGRIHELKIFGDFAGRREVRQLEERLRGVRYDAEALTKALAEIELDDYFGQLSTADFVTLLY